MGITTFCKFSIPILLVLFLSHPNLSAQKSLDGLQYELQHLGNLATSEVLVVGTHHFDEAVLENENQESILGLIQLMASFEPTKIVLELEPKVSEKLNERYRAFLADSTVIADRYNEVYQLGFRLAKHMGHDSIYLFDDQTEFIGSLNDYSFESFGAYAKENDSGFFDIYEKEIIENYERNSKIFESLSPQEEIILRNSPQAQRINKQRMHSYEVRVGIQKSWIGPDWLGRWYQRNIRMVGNVLKMNRPGDRILIIVGDNHKWILDMLFTNTPDFEVVSSWDFFSHQKED